MKQFDADFLSKKVKQNAYISHSFDIKIEKIALRSCKSNLISKII